MEYLKNFRYLKMDGSFIRDIDTNEKHRAFVEYNTKMAHKLGLKVIAEFVATPEIQDVLQKLHVDYSQGYLFSKPAPEVMGIKNGA